MLQNNRLSGELPQSIDKLVSAEEILLSNNNLKGSLPLNIGRLEKLRQLKVDGNRMTGSLPKDWKLQKIGKYCTNSAFQRLSAWQIFY